MKFLFYLLLNPYINEFTNSEIIANTFSN
jgi:hypothetical protein